MIDLYDSFLHRTPTTNRSPMMNAMQRNQITTAFEFAGQGILKNFGIVRGLTVRLRSVMGNFFAGIQSLFGGDISLYRELCEQARHDAFDQMCREADRLGANAIIGVRYDATEVMAGITEVICYGTAVRISEPVLERGSAA